VLGYLDENLKGVDHGQTRDCRDRLHWKGGRRRFYEITQGRLSRRAMMHREDGRSAQLQALGAEIVVASGNDWLGVYVAATK
jgi:hypothetical protein